MKRETLLDFFDDFRAHSKRYLVYDDGYRSWGYTYARIAAAAEAFALRLTPDEKVIVWAENRPEWIVALWGCLLAGAVAVPVDYRVSQDFLERVRGLVDARLILTGNDVSYTGNCASEKLATLLRDELQLAERFSPAPAITRDTLAEIIFTSGATAEPKGVIITHRNVLANIVPVEKEIHKYRRWGRPFAPIRFLNLLPLSHLFGQAMAAFIPPMLPGEVVFMRGHNPKEIVRQLHSRRISVLVCVPKILEVLRDYIVQAVPEAATPAPAGERWWGHWWRYRRVHRLLGWKFWSFVVGAAPLDPELEQFWSRLGFVVIQGYGLTETAPIVTLNHPFHARRGTVGKPIAGVQVKIAPDGEVMVRGENVTSGYFNSAAATEQAFEDGWFHTGDIGSMDAEGRLQIRGRKKEMIVTPEGLNVFPEDVERVLNQQPGVRDSAAIGTDRVHAVLILEPGVDPRDVVRRANEQLEDHQQIRNVSIWADGELPRTEGTRKLKRARIAETIASGAAPAAGGAAHGVAALLARYAPGRAIDPDTALSELGLSSLERVALMTALEQQGEGSLDESAFTGARTVAELTALAGKPRMPSEPFAFPAWNQNLFARFSRRINLPLWILPLARIFAHVRAQGLEHLAGLQGPVLFAASHQSHFDVPAILMALPARWRYATATAMSKEFFHAHFFPREHRRSEWLTNSLNYYLACLFFNAFPLPQREAGAREAMAHMGALASGGVSILIFPEGRITDDGAIQKFQPGVGMLASRLALPIVPIRLEGLHQVLPRTRSWPRPGKVRVVFGKPIHAQGEDYAAVAMAVEEAVRAL
jgi:long-chain acyl-CoA synthetase